MPEVTLIVPVYNTAPYLKRCLDSILSQTFQNFELLCINDGSIDNSLEILKHYAESDSRIKIISQKNKGLSRVRNRGIMSASTNYLMFIDSDDTIEANMLEKLYQNIIDNNCDIVLGNYKHLNQQGEVQKTMPHIDTTMEKMTLFKKVIINEISSSPCSCLYAKTLFTKNNLFFEDDIFFEDAAFQYKAIFYARAISILNEALYNYYHLNEDSITNTISLKHIEDLFFIFQDTASFLHKKQIQNVNYLLQLRIYNTLKYLLLKISRHALSPQSIEPVLKLLWEKTNSLEEFQCLTYGKKTHLIFLTLSLLKDQKNYDFFDFFHLSKQNIKSIQKYTKSPLGLMQAPIDYLKKNPYIKNIYIYGAGDILKALIPILEKLNINVLGIIDQEAKQISYKQQLFTSQTLENTPLTSNDIILVTSIAFADEIIQNIKSLQSNFYSKLKFITFYNEENE